MSDNKTRPGSASVAAFLAKKASAAQLADCQALMRLFKSITGKPAKMWGPSIVGFGAYHYVYPSGREGDAPLIGFSPRGRELVLYVGPGLEDKALVAKLGRHRAGAGCLYLKSLGDVDIAVLEKIARRCVGELRRRHPS